MDIVFHPIGLVRNSHPQGQKPPTWRGVRSRIELDPRWTPALNGLDDFSHLVVLCYLHLVPPDAPPTLIHPQRNAALPLLGFWSTRTPHRPNPIALTVVRLSKIENNILSVQDLDMFDGTPVLDIKPYLPPPDGTDQITLPQWVFDLRRG